MREQVQAVALGIQEHGICRTIKGLHRTETVPCKESG
jgi:hypothetical protein